MSFVLPLYVFLLNYFFNIAEEERIYGEMRLNIYIERKEESELGSK